MNMLEPSDKEERWLKERVGYMSASELNDVFTPSGKITEMSLEYIRRKRFERKHGFSFRINAPQLTIGKEMEQYAVYWFRSNYPDIDIRHAAEDFQDIPFWKVDWARFGASPDAFTPDESFVLEIKTLVGVKDTVFFADEFTPYLDKRSYVIKEHGHQIAGQFLSNDKVKEIWLLKYIYPREQPDDMDDVDAKWRGIIFRFTREDFDLEQYKDRISTFDKLIDAPCNPRDFKVVK